MPDLRYKRCRLCGQPSSVVGALSWQRLCEDCGAERRRENFVNLTEHQGPFFDHWRRQSAAAVGAVLLDDVLPPP